MALGSHRSIVLLLVFPGIFPMVSSRHVGGIGGMKNINPRMLMAEAR
jgi:hypothetical protein